MNTITQIENALQAISPASFQNLINHLLYLQGNKFVGAPGAVVGKEKTSKGAPDAFFVNEGKYIFVECTTKERLGKSKSFFEKLLKDIEHCFKEKKTSINKNNIEKVILAFTETISTEEYTQLKEKTFTFNPETQFEILNIQNLPLHIFDFPKLASEYLSIEIVKGDIFTLEDFLIKSTKGLQPSLTNEFIGREEELKKCIAALKNCDKLLLSGGAGVGKSKLAVKILEELSKEGYTPIVIQSSAVPLWDDFKYLFQPAKNYIVLFDDANKSIHNLNYLLSNIDKPQSYSVKVIITSRDYVKKQISNSLSNSYYEEVVISEFKDEEIEKIILAVLPNLKYHRDIKRKIVELAKGNARVALMATNSITPDAETNYLSSPVLLYEKYFKKISEEIKIFDNPIILKSLAIVSFFGVLDKNNHELQLALKADFEIDWNELWSAIMELHNHEILDVYSNEIVKISDQVLATYAFYKCFIDENSAVINYASWITAFIEKFPHRIKATLIDTNNTFVFQHVKELVVPHLNEVLKVTASEKQLYCFYTLFWFYKGTECLLYLKKWIAGLEVEKFPGDIKFTYVHNDHGKASSYFELLHNFWRHPNELLKPSLELTLDLLVNQLSRLPEILKFIHEEFKYQLDDLDHGYLRQNTLLDVLLDKNLHGHKQTLADGIFLNISEVLLGWHFNEFGASKRRAITIYNFDLYKSNELMALRARILNRVYELFQVGNEQIRKILNKIVYPQGDIDKTIYADEMPVYQKIISEKLDNKQYPHCKFVKALANHLTKAETAYPETWNTFIESDIIKLSRFLKPSWEYRNDKSVEESEKEKKQEFDEFILSNDWDNIQKFLLNIDELFRQQNDNNAWHIESAVTDIYLSIAKKGSNEFENALRLLFSGKVLYPLRPTVLTFAVQNNILTGEAMLHIMDEFEFNGKTYWKSVLLAMLPEEEVDLSFLKLLITIFEKSEGYIYIYSMLDYLKYDEVFQEYKKELPEAKDHNIITYLTSIILTRGNKSRRDFGFHFCEQCVRYFTNQIGLFKKAYIAQKEADKHFDHDGKELETVLRLDSNFFIEHLEQKSVDHNYLSFKLEDFRLDYIWTLPDYENIIEKSMNIIIRKNPIFSNWDHSAAALFTFHIDQEELQPKALAFLEKYMTKHIKNKQKILVTLNIVMHKFRQHFISLLKKFLTLNQDIKIFTSIQFDKGGVYSGSRVPRIQEEIDICNNVIDMIKELPNILNYSGHIDYLEQKIGWLKKDIKREQRREFEDEYY